jgi:hypothetical protein
VNKVSSSIWMELAASCDSDMAEASHSVFSAWDGNLMHTVCRTLTSSIESSELFHPHHVQINAVRFHSL